MAKKNHAGPKPITVRKFSKAKMTFIKPKTTKRFVQRIISEPGDQIVSGKK